MNSLLLMPWGTNEGYAIDPLLDDPKLAERLGRQVRERCVRECRTDRVDESLLRAVRRHLGKWGAAG